MSQNMYVVSSSIGDNGSLFRDKGYLLKVSGQKLDTIARISKRSEEIGNLKYYDEIKTLVYFKENLAALGNCKLVRIQFNPFGIDSINLKFRYSQLSLFFTPSLTNCNKQFGYNKLLINLAGNYGPANEKFFLIDVNTLKYQKASYSCFSNLLMTGEYGGALPYMDTQYIQFSKNKNLYLVSNDSSKWQKFEVQVPDSLVSKLRNKLGNICLNTNELFAQGIIEGNSNFILDSLKISLDSILILNKKSGKWNVVKIKGNQSRIKGFGKYISGIVIEYTKDYMTQKTLIKSKSKGYDYRKLVNFQSLSTFDDRCQEMNFYQPGILFLIDSETGRQIEWETGQGDSEILLVKDEIVYYRVYDKIYKRPLTKTWLGQPTLIAKHPLIIDVHWMWIN